MVRDGIRVTGPVRSIVDAAGTGAAPEQIMSAIGQALNRGIATQSKLLSAARARGGRVERLVRQAIEERHSMKYQSGAAFRQALEQRLLARSRETGTSLVRLRKAVVFDRLLARLTVAAPRRWVLKGALALDFRLRERTRTTKDMDLVCNDNETAATSDLIAAQTIRAR